MDVLTRLSFAVASSLLLLVIFQRIEMYRMKKKYEEMEKELGARNKQKF